MTGSMSLGVRYCLHLVPTTSIGIDSPFVYSESNEEDFRTCILSCEWNFTVLTLQDVEVGE